MRLREVNQPVQGHTANEWFDLAADSGCLVIKACALTTGVLVGVREAAK